MFITKAKYITLRYIVRKTVKIKRFINKMKLEAIEEFMLYGDNDISITLKT